MLTWSGDMERVEILLDSGADPNWSNPSGWTALHSAAVRWISP